MGRFLWRWVAPLVLALCCGLSSVSADDPDFKNLHPYTGGNAGAQPAAQLATSDPNEKVERVPPTLAVAVAVLSAVIVLCILCVPSRKAESSTSR